ncbi:hypothetical protein [Rhizobium phaseoli]|uniref:hypothetical protein n=1 Tax=Rhizobium phaseoli TaxID=396 RepID=UPI002556CEF7|nr:hypothetical protein [Rhizobium phaseoli]MDK4729355.1 hypothetical protein [Rhizobium phaseoli]
MTLNEFKAWLEGFEAGMSGNPPTAEQWAAIKAKLDTVKLAVAPVSPVSPRLDPFKAMYGVVGAADRP